jgi:hypothetical protein
MPEYSASMVAAGAGTTLRPVFGLLSIAASSPVLKEISIFNTTAVACQYRLVQLTGGTPGATVTARRLRRNGVPNLILAKQLWTADATIGEDLGYTFQLGATVGSGVIMPIADLEGDVGATAALGLVPIGTGQICTVGMRWAE